MSLDRLREDWELLGEEDPLWAILSDPEKRDNRWDLAEFLQTGRDEVDAALGLLSAHGHEVPRTAALDFGTGVGRLAQGLARHFHHVIGVDISEAMLVRARELAVGLEGVDFIRCASPDLTGLGEERFDLIYSRIVLQHIPAPFACAYITALSSRLTPDGLAVLQVPERPVARSELARHRLGGVWVRLRYRLKRSRDLAHRIQLAGVSVGDVSRAAAAGGAVVVDRIPDTSLEGWTSWTYVLGPSRPDRRRSSG